MKLDKLIPVRSAFHKVVNYFLGFLIGLFVLILIFLGFTQTATFREFARKQVLVILNDSINGRINFEQLDGSIFTTLIVRNATLISQGDTILSIGKVGVRLNPLRIFVKTIFVKELIIENVHANLYADSAGQYNISKVFPSSSDTSSSEFPFTITLEKGILTNINAVLCSGIRKAEKAPVPVLDMDNLRIENLNLELSAKANITKKEFLVSLFTATAKTNIQDFNINNFAAKISIKRDEIEITDMALKTDKSDLYFSSMIKGFHLFGDSLSADMHTADMNLSLRAFPFHFADLQSLIGVTDYLKGPLQGEIVASGTLDHLLIPKLDLSIGNSKLLVTGKLQKILDGSTMRIDAGITNSVLHREDVLSLLPIVTMPEFENYTTLQIDSLTYSGTPLTFETKMKIAANSGVIRGTVGFDFAKENTTYSIDLRGADVNLAPFIHHPAVFNGGVTVHGENFSPEKVDAAFTIDGAYSIIGRQIYNKLGLTGTLRAGIVDVDLLMKTEKDSVSGNLSASLFPDSLPTYTLSITGKHLNLSEVLMDSSLTSDLNFQFSIDGKSFTPDKIQGDAFLRIEKGFIGINDLDNVEARLSVAHKKDGTVFVSLTSDIIDAEISGTYKINGLLSVLQKEIKNVNRSVTDKLSGYFPELRKDIEAFLSQKTVLTKKVDSVYSGNIDSKFNIKIKDLSKLSGFIKGKEISFDGTIEGILKSNLESFVFEVTSEIGFFKYLDTASSMFIRDAAFKISVSHPYNDYRFGSIKNSVAFEADQAFLNADIKKVFISAALDSSRMKIVLRSEYGEKVNMQMNGTAFFNDDSLLLQLGTIKFKYNLFEVFNKLPSTITYTNGKFSIARLARWRGDAKLALDGTFSFKDSINLMFSSKNLKGYDLSFSILDTKADEVIDNDINIDAKITGTMVNPKIDVTLAVDSITYKKTTYGSYIGTLNYADKKLLVDLKLVEM
ncbi:MAG: hypothetical protein HYV28_06405, partial [Ignavibacteriales bacterium]|nr:hypothetical protein [Ignavibacteriales bacterium]